MVNLVINIVAFQVGWFALVLSGANAVPWWGAAVGLTIVTLHVWRAPQRGRELSLVLLVGLIGGIWDSVVVATGLLSYTSGTLAANTAPYWIVTLWLVFATTLNVSLSWLRQRHMLAATLGAVAGPLAYYVGARLGAVHFHDTALGLLVLGCGWAVLMPALMAVSERLDGFKSPRCHAAAACSPGDL